MNKGKKFREWIDEDENFSSKKDSKRYDKKKSEIQKARKDKRNSRNTYNSQTIQLYDGEIWIII